MRGKCFFSRIFWVYFFESQAFRSWASCPWQKTIVACQDRERPSAACQQEKVEIVKTSNRHGSNVSLVQDEILVSKFKNKFWLELSYSIFCPELSYPISSPRTSLIILLLFVSGLCARKAPLSSFSETKAWDCDWYFDKSTKNVGSNYRRPSEISPLWGKRFPLLLQRDSGNLIKYRDVQKFRVVVGVLSHSI